MKAPITDKQLLEMMWERFPEIMKRGIEQPAQQEPVAWMHTDLLGGIQAFTNEPPPSLKAKCRPLIFGDTSPSQRKPLTDEELRAIENKINPNMRWHSSDEEGITLYPIEYYELVRAIEAAHNIKEQP